MAKPISATCNLRCSYCYYLSKEQLLAQRRGSRMSTGVLENYVRQYLESQPGDELTFVWQGGEPMMLGLDFFREVLRLQAQYRRPGQRVHNDLQTNGTLLDAPWCVFLKKHAFLVGLSIDGPAALHDACRVDRRGRPTFDKVMAGARLLQKHKIPFSTLTVVGRHNAHAAAELYRFLTVELGSRSIQLIPCVAPRDLARAAPQQWPIDSLPPASDRAAVAAYVADYSVTPRQWGDFLCGFFDCWTQHGLGRVMVNLFESAVLQLLGYPALVCTSSERCGSGVVLEHDGSVYACDHYVYPAYRLGHIAQQPLVELVSSSAQEAFGRAKSDSLPHDCRRCPYLTLCWGECPRNRFTRAANGQAGLNYLCPGLRQFYAHALPRLQKLAGVVARRHAGTA
jgi:uncharacterized protein